jgi:LmbE family N-acetylglucosaminyl deacetylase
MTTSAHFKRWLGGILLAFFSLTQSAYAATTGWVDSVMWEGGAFRIKGWACEVGVNQPVQIDLWTAGSYLGRFNTGVPADPGVHAACGASGNFRFSVPMPVGASAGAPIVVNAVDTSGSAAAIQRSGYFLMTNTAFHPETFFAAASRILLFVAHPDDEILFAPMFGKYCRSGSGKTCKIISAADGRPDPSEFANSGAILHSAIDVGNLPDAAPGESVASLINRWEVIAQNAGLTSMNNVIKLQIDSFNADLIITFDPRTGTSCHPAHRAIGKVIADAAAAYTGSSLPDRQNVFLLTTKQTETVPPAAESVTLEAADLTDPTSVVYSSDDVLPGRGITGVSLMKSIINVYPGQISPTATRNGYAFPNDYSSWLDRGFPRTTAFQRVNDYNPSAGNYTSRCP